MCVSYLTYYILMIQLHVNLNKQRKCHMSWRETHLVLHVSHSETHWHQSISFIITRALPPKDTFDRQGKWSKLDFPIFSYASLVYVVSHALWCPQCEINQQNIHLRPPAVKMANQLRDTNGNRPLLIKSFPRVMKFPSSGISVSFRFPGGTPKLYKFQPHTKLFLYQH